MKDRSPKAPRRRVFVALLLSFMVCGLGLIFPKAFPFSLISRAAGGPSKPAPEASSRVAAPLLVATTLSASQIAIIQYNTDDADDPHIPGVQAMQRDSISFVLLAPVDSTTTIFFTDRSWNGTTFGAAGGGEGTYTWNSGSARSAGTVITISEAELTAAGMELVDTGETIYAYQGAINAPSPFLYAVDIADENNTFEAAKLTNTGLSVAGGTAAAIGIDNGSFGERFWHQHASVLLQNISDAASWNTNQNSPQSNHTEGTNLFVAPDVQLWIAGISGGHGLMSVSGDSTQNSGLGYNHQTYFQNTANDGDGTTTTSRFWSPTHILFDTVQGRFFIVDSSGSIDRILQGNISDMLINPGEEPPMTILWQDTPLNTSDGDGITSIQLDKANTDIYFTADHTLHRIDYNTANQLAAVTVGSPGAWANELALDLPNGRAFIPSTETFSDFLCVPADYPGAFPNAGCGTGYVAVVTSVIHNAIHMVSNISPGDTDATGNTSVQLNFNEAFNEDNGFNGDQPNQFDDAFGKLTDVDVNRSTGEIWFTAVDISSVPNGIGGIYKATLDLGTNTLNATQIYSETDATNHNFFHIHVDEETGFYYVTSVEPGEQGNHSVFRGALNSAPGTAPTLYAEVGNINEMTPRDLTVESAPTVTATNLAASVTEASNLPGSGLTAGALLFSSVTASDIDTVNGTDELAGAQVRITGNYQTGASHQDSLRIDGNESGTISGSGITYSFNATTGILTLSGPGTVVEYQAALALVAFHTSGDNITNYGQATTRTVAASVFDGLLYSDEITNTVTVVGINDAPVNVIVGGTARSVNEDTNLSVTGLSVGDVDADPASQQLVTTLSVLNGTLTVASAGGAAVSGSTTGTVTLTGTATQINTTLGAASNILYRGNQDYFGPDTLTFKTNDQGNTGNDPGISGTGTSEEDSDTINITVIPVNDAPTASGDALSSIAEDSGQRTIPFADLTGNDSTGPANENTQTLIVKTVSSPVGGTVLISGGNVLFTPTLDYNGPASFQYTVEDNGQSGSPLVNDFKTSVAAATVSFTITEVNDAPTVTADAISNVAEDSAQRTITIASLLSNDLKGPANESGQTLTFVSAGNSVGGTVTSDAINVYFTPAADFNGPASFDYTITDNGTTNGANDFKTGTGTVSFTVTAVNDAPVLDETKTPALAVNEDPGAPINGSTVNSTLVSALIDLAGGGGLDNVTEPDGTSLTGIALTGVNTANGTWYYTTNGGGTWSAVGVVTDDSALLLAADANTRLYFQPTAADFNGLVTNAITFRAWDQSSGTNGTTTDPSPGGVSTAFSTASDTANITVTAINDAPSFTAGPNQTVNKNAPPQTVNNWATNMSAGPADESGQPLTFNVTNNTNPALFSAGPVIDPTTGTLTYTPANNAFGTATITITLSDNGSNTPPNSNTSGQQNFDITVLNCENAVPVTNLNDAGAGSLRQAIADVCDGGTIDFNIDPGAGPHAITLVAASGALTISKNLTINNTSGESITVNGAAGIRVFTVASGKTVAISDLTVTGGAPTGAVFPAMVGGGIFNEGTLTLTNITVSNSSAADFGGGGIYNLGVGAALNLITSTVSGNDALGGGGGGGIFNNGGTVMLLDSTVSGNDANGDGGGINNNSGSLTLTNSTISANNALLAASGGGIMNFGTLTVTNSTISGNNANLDGGGLYINATGATFTSVTFSNNRADNDSNATGTGGGIFVFAGTPELRNTIVAGNFNENDPAADTADDIVGTVNATSSFNLIGTGGAGGLTTTGAPTHNQVGVASPGLGLLLNNGGPTFTHALLTGSLAIDQGDDFTLTTDQRGQPRPVDIPGVTNLSGGTGDGSDIGAFEKGFSPIPVVTTTAGNLSYAENDPATAIDPGLTVTDDDSTNLVDASASITTNFQAGQDVLSWIDNNAGDNITLSGTSTAQTIVLTGTDTLANYEAALRAVTYQNSSNNPSVVTRTVTFTVNDGTNTGSGTRGIAVSASNDNPAINSNGGGPTASVNAAENQTAVTTVTSTDPDGGTPSYSLSGGADMGAFSIGSSSGVLTFNTPPNFEAPTDANTDNVYEVTVQVSDGNAGTDTQAISVTVTNVNDAPIITSNGGGPTANINVPENTTAVTTVTSSDADGGTPSYSISGGGDMGAFSIGSSSGILTFSSAPNFESPTDANTDNVYEVTVQVSDGASGLDTQAISVTVTNVNEAPVNTVPGAQGTALNTPLTFSSGNGNQISVADVDAGSSSIQVALSATNGTLTLNGTTGLNFACGGCAGDGTADASMTFQGTLTDVNNALNGMTFNPTPAFSGPASVSMTSNDLGNTGSGGPQTDGPDTVNIQVSSEVSVNDATAPEPASGTSTMLFTVSLNTPAPAGGASVNYTTADEPAGLGKAVAGVCGSGGDYVLTSGTITFAAGEQVKTISVPVCSDAASEPDETFLVNLSSPVNATIADGTATGTITAANTAGAILISEIRTSGPAGSADEFVEIYNNSNSPHTVAASDASAGYGVYRMGADCNATPVLVGTIPNGAVIPARGHYLFVGATYSLGAYAAGNATLTADIPSDANVGLFKTANVGAISSVLRLDAVGFGTNTGGNCDLLREGSNLPAVAGSVTEHSFFRKLCDFTTACTTPGLPKDTNNNATDFLFADTAGTLIPGIPRLLGAPGPENLASPLKRDAVMPVVVLDASVAPSSPPNRTRDLTSNPGNNSTFGTLSVRRRIVNGTGGNVTRLRFRIVEMTTFQPLSAGVADLRALSSSAVVVSGVNDSATCLASTGLATTPCTVTVQGTTLEQPPTQTSGGGLNATLAAGTITTGTPLAPGDSVNVQFLLGVQQTGNFRFLIIVEALP